MGENGKRVSLEPQTVKHINFQISNQQKAPYLNNFQANEDLEIMHSYVNNKYRDRGGLDSMNAMLYDHVNSSNYG